MAARYDRMHRRWLRRTADALAALQGSLLAELRPGLRVLDVGCGTGALAWWLVGVEPNAALTLVDAAPEMLARAAVPAARRVRADASRLPFADATFDVVIGAWVLETLEDPIAAIDELLRLLRPGGLLCICYCTTPTHRSQWWRTLPVRQGVERLFRGRFLSPLFPDRAAGFPSRLLAPFRRLQSRTGLATFALCRSAPMGPAERGG